MKEFINVQIHDLIDGGQIDMIEVKITKEFMEDAEKAIDLMCETDFQYICRTYALTFTPYTSKHEHGYNAPIDVDGTNFYAYCADEDDGLERCDVTIHANGKIEVEFFPVAGYKTIKGIIGFHDILMLSFADDVDNKDDIGREVMKAASAAFLTEELTDEWFDMEDDDNRNRWLLDRAVYEYANLDADELYQLIEDHSITIKDLITKLNKK